MAAGYWDAGTAPRPWIVVSALFASMFDDHTIDMVYLMNTAGAGVGS